MNRAPRPSNYAAVMEEGRSSGELLVLPDGRILAHNITPALAALLAELDPSMRVRAAPPPAASAGIPGIAPSTPSEP